MGLSSIVRIKKRAEISSSSSSSNNDAQHAGLRIVILQISEFDDQYSSNTVVVKSGLKSLTRTNITSSSSSSSSSVFSSTNNNNNNGEFNCFLTSCHLCKKPLSPDKDVYMYRGDQGFCSKECRSKQIMVDEMKEMDEKRTKKKRVKDNAASSSPIVVDCVGCETCTLLQDLRKRRHLRNANKFKPAHVFISSAKHQPLISFS